MLSYQNIVLAFPKSVKNNFVMLLSVTQVLLYLKVSTICRPSLNDEVQAQRWSYPDKKQHKSNNTLKLEIG